MASPSVATTILERWGSSQSTINAKEAVVPFFANRPYVSIPMNISDGLSVSTGRTPNKLAVVQGDKRLTFRQVSERANRLANALRALGLDTGDKVGVMMANIPEYIEICFGLSRSGFVIVPISHRVIGTEAAYHLSDSGARALIFDGELDGAVEAARKEAPDVAFYIRIGEESPGSLE